MKNIPIKITLLSITLFTMSLPLLAQGAPPATPIDGGLSLLLAAGGLYGLKKLRDSRK
jgi:hypothetical protein